MNDPEEAFNWQGWQSAEDREVHFQFIDDISALPVISLFCNPGIYGWMLLLMFGFLAYKRNLTYACVFVAAFALFLTCVACPVNGSIRYSLGYIAAMPLLLGCLKCVAGEASITRFRSLG